MSTQPHLTVKSGPDKGLTIIIPESGARVGRSSDNDISLSDSLLSRHHCRFEFRPGDGLWAVDLESANETLVNDVAISSIRLNLGDRILLGDSLLVVLNDQPDIPKSSHPAPIVDLGFSPDESETVSRSNGIPSVVWVVTIITCILVIFFFAYRLFFPTPAPERDKPLEITKPLFPLQVVYEKVDASNTNIFRYAVEITSDNYISCSVDSVVDNRHIRKTGLVSSNDIKRLSQQLNRIDLESLNGPYEGIAESGLRQWSLTVIIGNTAHHCVVKNQTEPPTFREAREAVEIFTRSQLGLWAIHYSETELKKLALESYRLGRKLYDERDSDYGNISASITAYKESKQYLETISPKPDYFNEMLSHETVSVKELDTRYKDLNFRAQQDMNLGKWQEAADRLRVVLDLIPDVNDARHQEATKKLLEAESRADQFK